MSLYILIILLVIIAIIYFKYFNKRIEGLQTFAGRLAIDDQYFYDKLFDDVYYYPNEGDGTTGWQRCKTECAGHCVEYGVHGVSYCFPY